jgi:hypothetical protein
MVQNKERMKKQMRQNDKDNPFWMINIFIVLIVMCALLDD